MDRRWWKLGRPEVLPVKRKRHPRVIKAKKWTIYLKAINLYMVWLQKSRRSKGCAAWHNASNDVTSQQVSVGHVDFGAMISNSPKVTTLAFGQLISIWAQLQDLRAIVASPLQGRPKVLYFLMLVWVGKPSRRPTSVIWPNGPNDKSYMDAIRLRPNCPSCIYSPINA